jgi:tRNA A37 threonylcarbamoyladenosine synthetase subunit TsaC/SUA5/YrdC
MSDKTIPWNGSVQQEAVELLAAGGALVVAPTKVGYILLTSDGAGLERKFEAKERNRNKPGVVLCGSLDELRALAQLTPEIEALYERCWDDDVLLGCILPWKPEAINTLPDDGARDLMMDSRGTSCFVIRFGTPGELIADELWQQGRFVFASSANPSGRGNRGLVAGIGDRIRERADLIIDGDEFVASIQPDKTIETRYEQGVMVSMVDDEGALVPVQEGCRSVTPAPTVIRKGLAIDQIMALLAVTFTSWNFRQGEYY